MQAQRDANDVSFFFCCFAVVTAGRRHPVSRGVLSLLVMVFLRALVVCVWLPLFRARSRLGAPPRRRRVTVRWRVVRDARSFHSFIHSGRVALGAEVGSSDDGSHTDLVA